MKKLQIHNEVEINKIDASRYLHQIIENTFEVLKKSLGELSRNMQHEKTAVNAISSAWQIIDNAYRYCGLIRQIRGIKHNCNWVRMLDTERNKLSKFRNYIQHLNSDFPNIPAIHYPILGAISWTSNENYTAHTISIGATPKGTRIDSLHYDAKTEKFSNSINFDVLDGTIEIIEHIRIMNICNDNFKTWLDDNEYTNEIEQSIFSAQITLKGSKDIISDTKIVWKLGKGE